MQGLLPILIVSLVVGASVEGAALQEPVAAAAEKRAQDPTLLVGVPALPALPEVKDPCFTTHTATKCGPGKPDGKPNPGNTVSIKPTLQIACPAGQKIKVYYAMYGRTSVSICSQFFGSLSNTCSFPGATTYVQGMCDGQQTCSVDATTPTPFPDPCPGIHKYLTVRWRCCSMAAFRGCVKKVRKIMPVVGICKSKHPVYVGRCQGGCPSSEKVDYVTAHITRKCKCCKAYYGQELIPVTLECDTSNAGPPWWHEQIEHWYRDVKRCSCKDC